MKVLKLQQNSDEWFDARKGRVTGTKLKDILVKRGTGRKIGFYQLIADRIALDPDDEDVRERGHRLEAEAIQRFEQDRKVTVETDGFWISDFNENVAFSPDGVIKGKPEGVEIKCLSTANHLKAYIENAVPPEYADQVIQAFIVNEKLKKMHVVFYDPRVPAIDFHVITVEREQVEELVEQYKEYQINLLKEVDAWVERLTF